MNVLLIFKEGKKKDPSNSKCVSFTSVPGGVMEKTILEGIEIHLKDNTFMLLHALEILGL